MMELIAMKPLDQEQRLGYRAFVFILLRKEAPALALLILAYLAEAFGNKIRQGAVDFISLSGINASSGLTLLSWISGLIIGLFLASLIMFVVGYIVALLVYDNYTVTIEEFDLKLKRGIFNLEEISIPFRHMQDVNVDRSLLYRLLGISRVIIDSAGQADKSEQNKTHILLDPIDKDLAESIFLNLQRKIGVQVIEGEGTADRKAAGHVEP